MYQTISLCAAIYLITVVWAAPVIQPQHEPLNEPGSFDQLVEAWEEEDGMSPDDFSPKSFFMMHDLDGNNELSSEEIAVILERELEKLNSTERSANRTYVANVLKEMQEYFMEHFDHNNDGKITLQEFTSTIGEDSKQHTGEWTPHEDQLRVDARQQDNLEQGHRAKIPTDPVTQHTNPSPGSVAAQSIHSGGPSTQSVHGNNVHPQPTQGVHVGSAQARSSHQEMHPTVLTRKMTQAPDHHDTITVAHPSQMNNNNKQKNKFGTPLLPADHFQSGHVNAQQDSEPGLHPDYNEVLGVQSPHLNNNNYHGAHLTPDESAQIQLNHPEMHPGVPMSQRGQHVEYHDFVFEHPSQLEDHQLPANQLRDSLQAMHRKGSLGRMDSQSIHSGET